MSTIAGSRQLSCGHAETEIVAVWISYRKLTQFTSDQLAPCELETQDAVSYSDPACERSLTLINVVHKHTVDGAEDTVS